MLLVSVQNPVTKESKVSVVMPCDAGEFFNRCVPNGSVALVQDIAVYIGEATNLDRFVEIVAPDIYEESLGFRNKWYNHFKTDEK